ncbi:MAG: arsenosugar biosynthesis radical SAM (seleno)protein ArsS [Planctomycetota bacterium]
MRNRFDQQLDRHALAPLTARGVTTLQVNLGKLCNQACRHCHVDAGPHQTGADVNMGEEVAELVIEALRRGGIATLDLTGGAAELNPHFRRLVQEARDAGVHVMDRCNLSVLFEAGQEDLGAFLAEHRVAVVASLPYYRKDRTDRQRGAGVFDRSIDGLLALNQLGYGNGNGERQLDLVYNPVGAYLPADQHQLEADFKRELRQQFDIVFDHLYCITNMPIARFLEWLQRSGNEAAYMKRLLDAFNPAAVPGVMCRDLISIGPDGTVYDCDFNQMLGLPITGERRHLRDLDWDAVAARPIVTRDHCLGCTAGAGSSCGGVTAG